MAQHVTKWDIEQAKSTHNRTHKNKKAQKSLINWHIHRRSFAWGAKGQGFKSPRPDHFKPRAQGQVSAPIPQLIEELIDFVHASRKVRV